MTKTSKDKNTLREAAAPSGTGAQYWLVKSEPQAYSWDRFVKDGKAVWDGVRNYQARNNLQSMKKGDPVLFYHSNEGMEIVGLATVSKTAYQDPTTEDPRWVVVDLKPLKPFKKPVTLSGMKTDKRLAAMALIRQGRRSVSPVSPEEFKTILSLGETSL